MEKDLLRREKTEERSQKPKEAFGRQERLHAWARLIPASAF
jgi:hypothetical protein